MKAPSVDAIIYEANRQKAVAEQASQLVSKLIDDLYAIGVRLAVAEVQVPFSLAGTKVDPIKLTFTTDYSTETV